MKKLVIFMLLILLMACKKEQNTDTKLNDTLVVSDSIEIVEPIKEIDENPKEHSNNRFRKVIVEKISDEQYKIHGEAQVFEANFNWVIEDGHNELNKGFVTAEMGAPEWGKFDFTVNAQRNNDYSTLHLIIFETSAKDGSRQHELPLLLE